MQSCFSLNKDSFREIQKAYEVLSDPNQRAAYDLENNIEIGADDKDRIEREYATTTGKPIYKGTRTIKNFYYNKWTGYRTPDWTNAEAGHDSQSEYMFRNKDDDFEVKKKDQQRSEFYRKYRLVGYVLFLIALDLFLVADNYFGYKNYRLVVKTYFAEEI